MNYSNNTITSFQCAQRYPSQNYNVNFIASIHALLSSFTNKHCKTFAFCLTLGAPMNYSSKNYPPNKTPFNVFINSYISWFHRNNIDAKYAWCCETAPSTGRIHWHLFILVNGSKIQNSWGQLERARKLWNKRFKEPCTVNLSKRHSSGLKVDRDKTRAIPEFNEAIDWMSYLAKNYSKGSLPTWQNEWFCSAPY